MTIQYWKNDCELKDSSEIHMFNTEIYTFNMFNKGRENSYLIQELGPVVH